MGSHHEEPPVQAPDVPAEEGISDDAASDLAEESTEKTNYTERHPEHFRRPPQHVRDLREGAGSEEEDD